MTIVASSPGQTEQSSSAAVAGVALADVNTAMEAALQANDAVTVVRMASAVLAQLPRHVATYARLVRAALLLQRWDEGELWARRLLRADPASALAWRAVALAAEHRGERAQAYARWQRGFECDPYEPDLRAGLVRTHVNPSYTPQLNLACLAALYGRGRRWDQAAVSYAALRKQDPHRLDFQSGLLLALWQKRADDEAYDIADRLTRSHPFLLLGWVVIDAVGDANDKALARHPLVTMDPDGDYARWMWSASYPARPAQIPWSVENPL